MLLRLGNLDTDRKAVQRRLADLHNIQARKKQQEEVEKRQREKVEKEQLQREEAQRRAEMERQAENKRRLQALEEQRQENRRQAESMNILMSSLKRNATESHERLLTILSEILDLQEQIDIDFKETAYAPFWDGICSLAVKMERFRTEMKSLAACYENFERVYEKYSSLCYERYLNVDAHRRELLRMVASVDSKTIHQMTDWYRTTVRKGQRNHDFADIYEHYRTRDVLIDGFSDLAKRLGDISRVLVSINTNLIEGFRELNESIGYLQESIQDGFEYLQVCVRQEGERTRHVIQNEGQMSRILIAEIATISELLAERRHRQLLASQEASRRTIEEAQERTRQSIEAGEIREEQRHQEAITTQENTRQSIETSEIQEQERHQEVMSETERDRRLIEEIDRKLAGDEWYKI